ncbi:thymine dioxygenase [Coccidioides immitis H538.4]|uniref:Thymine dioxygenase n=1 Tax=Coccidioides immitis H538.4 TaxID=396776 RepID=A0A0J8RPN1_COCIT|nr:thymine dioxygenase [Coccidioides immitis H538.4]
MVPGQAASDSEPESSPKGIPVVDFANWKRGSSREERMKVAQEIVSACRDVGFVYIVNHGMAPEKVAEAFAWSEKFFNLSSDEKQKAPHPSGASVHRGYSSPGLEKVSQAMSDKEDPELAKRLREITDYKESYDIGSDGNQDQPNVWIPEEMLPGFRSFMTQFYWDCFEVTKNVLGAISIGIGLEEEDYLLKFHSGHNNQLRLLHYPPLPAALLEEQKYARMPSHTDWSTITFLFQDECGGIISAQLFIGVTLPPLSDRYEGFNRMVRGRYSIPYFTAPDPTSVIKCLPSCVSEDKPASYLPITQHDYNRLRATTHYETAATNTGSGAAY